LITKKDEVVALYKKKCPFLNQDIKPVQKQQKDDVTRADERLEILNYNKAKNLLKEKEKEKRLFSKKIA